MDLFEQPEQRLGDDRNVPVILHELEPRRNAFEHALFLGAREQARGNVGRLSRCDRRKRLAHADAVERRIDLFDVDVALRALLRNPCGGEVMLHHRDPAVVGGAGDVDLVLVDVAERDLLEVMLVRVDGRSDERVREARRFDRLAVAHELHVGARLDRSRADVLDFRVDADHVAAARERVGLDDLHAALDRRLEGQLQRFLSVLERAGAGDRRVDVVMIREIAADEARACEIRVFGRAIEQRDVQRRGLRIGILGQDELIERTAARIDLAVVDVGAEVNQLRGRLRLGRRRAAHRSGGRARRRGGLGARRVRCGRRRAGAGLVRRVREEHRRAAVIALPVVEQHDSRHEEDRP